MQQIRKNALTSGHKLSRLNKEDLTQLLVLRVQQMIKEGILKPGAKLPAERELAAHFRVARSSLRPALKALEMMGVIQQRIGDGSYLNPDASAVLTIPMQFLLLLDGTSVHELTELRMLIEPAVAARAAERATADDISLLKHSIKDMRQSKGDQIKLISSDLLFHRVIFESSGNRLMSRIFHTIHHAMSSMMMLTSQLVQVNHTVGFHQPICDAIERRDAAQAFKFMAEHMVDAAQLLKKAQDSESKRALREHLSMAQPVTQKSTGSDTVLRAHISIKKNRRNHV
jgi:GntR family transcriptional regulator, transcriptional repressor for pyruvate dehydrogenase complex